MLIIILGHNFCCHYLTLQNLFRNYGLLIYFGTKRNQLCNDLKSMRLLSDRNIPFGLISAVTVLPDTLKIQYSQYTKPLFRCIS